MAYLHTSRNFEIRSISSGNCYCLSNFPFRKTHLLKLIEIFVYCACSKELYVESRTDVNVDTSLKSLFFGLNPTCIVRSCLIKNLLQFTVRRRSIFCQALPFRGASWSLPCKSCCLRNRFFSSVSLIKYYAR